MYMSWPWRSGCKSVHRRCSILANLSKAEMLTPIAISGARCCPLNASVACLCSLPSATLGTQGCLTASAPSHDGCPAPAGVYIIFLQAPSGPTSPRPHLHPTFSFSSSRAPRLPTAQGQPSGPAHPLINPPHSLHPAIPAHHAHQSADPDRQGDRAGH